MNDIRSILERLQLLEGNITPTNVKSGLNAQQKSVPQLPALFKPKHISVLKSKMDPQHPMKGYAVGNESRINEDSAVEEDVLSTVKKGLTDYLKQIEDEIEKKKDGDLAAKPLSKDVQAKKKSDSDLKVKVTVEPKPAPIVEPVEEVDEYPLDDINPPVAVAEPVPVAAPVLPQSHPIKSVTFEDGRICEIHGNEHEGFHVQHDGRKMKSTFKDLGEAEMAIEMFQARMRKSLESADYLDER